MRLLPPVSWVRLVLLSSALASVLLADDALSQSKTAEAEKQSASEPPGKRVLTKEDVKRVADLEAKLQKAGSLTEAVAVARKILEVRTQRHGADHGQMVDVPWQLKSMRKIMALPAADQKEWASTLVLQKEADELEAKGRYAEAQPLYQKVLDLRLKLLGENHPSIAASYNNLALNLNRQGRYAEAQPLCQKALDLFRKLLGENNPNTATSYSTLALNLHAQGRYGEAQPLYQKALDLRLKLLGENHAATARSYNNLAFNLQAQGRYAEAQPLYRKGLDLHRKLLGEHHADTATSYNNVAYNLHSQGRYAEAQPLYQKALDLSIKTLGEHHPDTATSYNNLAFNLNAQGRYAEARRLYQKALDLYLQRLGEDHALTALGYNNVAHNLQCQGRYAEAQPLYQKALDLSIKVLGEHHPDTAQSYNNLADNLQAQGRYAEAQALFQKALDRYLKRLGERHPDTARSYYNLAINLKAQGRYGEAQPRCQKALDLRRQLLGEHHPDTAQAYYNLASNLVAQGKYDQAEEILVRAATSYTQARRQASFSGSERANTTGLPSPLPFLAAVSARNGTPGPAWTHLEEDLGRGLLDDLATRQLAAQKFTPQERQRQQELVAALQGQEKLFHQPPPRSGDHTEAQERWAELTRHYQEAQTALGQFQAEMAQKYDVAIGQPYDLPHIQAQLPADAALLTWVDSPGKPKAADPNGEHWACLVRAKRTPVWERLPGTGPGGAWTKADDDLPHRLRQALAKHQDDSPLLAQKLYLQRLAPLEQHLGPADSLPAVRYLIVLPVRWMAGVPVEALTDRYTISYAPSGTLFAKLREEHPAEPTQPPPRLLALGDPAFAPPAAEAKPVPKPPDHGVLLTRVERGSNAERAGLQAGDVLLRYAGTQLADAAALTQAIGQQSPKPDSPARGVQTVTLTVWREGQILERTAATGRLGVEASKDSAAAGIQARRETDALLRGLRGDTFRPLPGSRAEVQAITALFPQADTLLGSEASEQRLDDLVARGRLRQCRYLHFATHGKMNDGIPLQSCLALAQDHLPDPLAQVLAGQKVYDGRLTAEQILQSWQLDADLVALSACQTGLGREGGGDGYIGFAQVLFLAGARSVLLSLWEVDDTATALLMTRFYQNLLGKREGLEAPMAKAEALREAKHWLRTLSAEEACQRKAQLPGAPRGEQVVDDLPAPSTVHPYEHPYYWAAFILIGDPGDQPPEPVRPQPPRSLAFWSLAAGLLAGGLLLGVLVHWRRSRPGKTLTA